ncbi:MAG: Alpha-glucosidase, partial [Streblomastix strix]
GPYKTAPEAIRLFNLDIFQYDTDSVFPLYGTIPLLMSQASSKNRKNVGIFWVNAADTYVDLWRQSRFDDFQIQDQISQNKKNKDPKNKKDNNSNNSTIQNNNNQSVHSHFISETGRLDFFILSGNTPLELIQNYAQLVGTTALPPLFSLGYHQCRWNYNDENDCNEVMDNLDADQIPYDVLWLDIEHTDGKRYFTWDRSKFPSPDLLQRRLGQEGRHLVTIVDPHVKSDSKYQVFKEAKEKGQIQQLSIAPQIETVSSCNIYSNSPKDSLLTNTRLSSQSSYFEGNCWPGNSVYPDFLSAAVRSWWASNFQKDKYPYISPIMHHWNDMNEPTVFSGREGTLPRDSVHLNGQEHSEVHNLFGGAFVMASVEAAHIRQPADRPFILTRSFFAGTHRYSAVWTGDNQAKWEHLRNVVPMLLSLNSAQYSFSGADIGGFFFHPSAELMLRWYQLALFTPFFRSHAHLESPRREPWVFEDPYRQLMGESIRLRYKILPLIYRAMFDAKIKAVPPLQSVWMQFDEDDGEERMAVDDEQDSDDSDEYKLIIEQEIEHDKKVKEIERQKEMQRLEEEQRKKEQQEKEKKEKEEQEKLKAQNPPGTENNTEISNDNEIDPLNIKSKINQRQKDRLGHHGLKAHLGDQDKIKEKEQKIQPVPQPIVTPKPAQIEYDENSNNNYNDYINEINTNNSILNQQAEDEDEVEDKLKEISAPIPFSFTDTPAIIPRILNAKKKNEESNKQKDSNKKTDKQNNQQKTTQSEVLSKEEKKQRLAQMFIVGGDVLVEPVVEKSIDEMNIFFPVIDYSELPPGLQEINYKERIQKEKLNESVKVASAVKENSSSSSSQSSSSSSSQSQQQTKNKPCGWCRTKIQLTHTPAYQRGGSIIPVWNRTVKSTHNSLENPLTLIVAPDSRNIATGTIFLDDGRTHAWEVIGQEELFEMAAQNPHIFDPPNYPPQSEKFSKDSPSYRPTPACPSIRHPTWESIVECSYVEIVIIRGQKSPPLNVFFRNDEPIKRNDSNTISDINLRWIYDDRTQTIAIIMPREAKTVSDWTVSLTLAV